MIREKANDSGMEAAVAFPSACPALREGRPRAALPAKRRLFNNPATRDRATT